MLNELFQVARALDNQGVTVDEQHPSLDPMGKNAPLLILELDSSGAPARFTVTDGDVAGKLLRICHASKGSSFPGFNLPGPLRTLPDVSPNTLKEEISALRRRKPSAGEVRTFIQQRSVSSRPASFTLAQSKQFQRSCRELAGWLREDFANAGPELENFRRLLAVTMTSALELGPFAEQVARLLATTGDETDATRQLLVAEWLFSNPKLPVYLQAHEEDDRQCRVADIRMGKLLNRHLLAIDAKPFEPKSRISTNPMRSAISLPDSFTGRMGDILDKFPEPKIAHLGNVRLFSNNTNEAACFFRYGLGGTETFKVSPETGQRMAGALLQLASEDRVGKTCRAIPGNRDGKNDLLIAYLESDPNASDPYIELFGAEAQTFDSPDFAASVKPVLEALAGKVAANPNQLIRLIALASLDKANKQISLYRSYTVRDVAEAAIRWQAGAANCPPVTLPFFDKAVKRTTTKERCVPSPLDLATLLNRVWSTKGDGGLRSDYQRIVTASDAYDLFLAPQHQREVKACSILQTLIARMTSVFAAAGRLKATSDFKSLNEPTRWQVLKAVALIGILLDQLRQPCSSSMKEPTYQLGRLLAYADSLHQQYCTHVRGGETPSQLIGNALFATALDQPVFALARLAERLVPYQAWARTFRNTNPEVKSGYEKTLLKLIGECTACFIEAHDGTFVIRVDELPQRMTDTDKAKLLLGYLADHPKSNC